MLDWYENRKHHLSGNPPAPGEIATPTAGTPEQKVLQAQPESALERLPRTRPKGNGNAPDRR